LLRRYQRVVYISYLVVTLLSLIYLISTVPILSFWVLYYDICGDALSVVLGCPSGTNSPVGLFHVVVKSVEVGLGKGPVRGLGRVSSLSFLRVLVDPHLLVHFQLDLVQVVRSLSVGIGGLTVIQGIVLKLFVLVRYKALFAGTLIRVHLAEAAHLGCHPTECRRVGNLIERGIGLMSWQFQGVVGLLFLKSR
jgi:hypothetical protein